ncbi:RusA family crossover junction endodeoxyribonuclease [Rhodococcus sp. NPDC057014]|uniref:RusA family crossover junction endodeoxyribonuclease n=1 Tax=Rhodococcus sp. NPDC057014 TaxID=3346000 RepID=UPI003641E03B
MIIPSHPIEIELAQAADTTAEERLDVIWKHYEKETGRQLDRPPTVVQRQEVHDWLNQHESHIRTIAARKPQLVILASSNLLSKANTITQLTCPSCEIETDTTAGPSLDVSFPIQVLPWSAQARSVNNTKIKAAVTAELATRHMFQGAAGSRPMCVSISSVVPHKQRKKDVDNLVKGLLDSLTSVLYDDDRQVQCLTTRRFEYSGSIGFYFVRARTVRPWEADVVWPEALQDPIFGVGQPIT